MKTWEEIYSQSPIHEAFEDLLWNRRSLILYAERFCEAEEDTIAKRYFKGSVSRYRKQKDKVYKMMEKFPRSYRKKLYRQYKGIY